VADTLQEYLIKLGFSIDELTWKKFQGAVKVAAEGTAELGAGALAAATAVGIAVKRVSDHYAQLFYISQRSGQSLGFLRSYGLASREIGISSEQAMASVNAMGLAIRTNPGIAMLAQAFTGKRNPNPIELVQGLSKRFPDFIATQYASMFGMSAEEYLHINENMPRLLEAQKYYTDLLGKAGLTTKQAEKNWVEMSQSLSRVGSAFEVVENLIVKDLIDSGVITFFGDAAKTIAETFVKLDNALYGKLGLLTVAFTALTGELGLEAFLFKMFGLPKVLTSLLFGRATAAGVGAAGAGVAGSAAGVAEATVIGSIIGSSLTSFLMRYLLGPLGFLLGSIEEANKGEFDIERYMKEHPGVSFSEAEKLRSGIPMPLTPGAKAPTSLRELGEQTNPRSRLLPGRTGENRPDRNNNPGNIEYGPFAVAHGAIGSDGRFAIFPSNEAGEAAASSLLQTKSYRGLNLAQIEQKWVHGRNKFTESDFDASDMNYLRSMKSATGLRATDIPDLGNAELARRLMHGMARGEGSTKSGQSNPINNINQNITINNAKEPAETAKQVKQTLGDMNRDIGNTYRQSSIPVLA
jgi:hypothetical protein